MNIVKSDLTRALVREESNEMMRSVSSGQKVIEIELSITKKMNSLAICNGENDCFEPCKNVFSDVTCFPPEIHVAIAEFLDSKSLIALRQSHPVFRNHIGMESVLKKREVEFELKKKETEQKFRTGFEINENGKSVNPDLLSSLIAITESPKDREKLELIISDILRDKKLTRFMRDHYSIFNTAAKNHEDYKGHFPAEENWNRQLENQRQTFNHHYYTWLNSFVLEILYRISSNV